MSPSEPMTWPSMPSNRTELLGTESNRYQIDLTTQSEARLMVNVITPGRAHGSQFTPPAASLDAEFSRDEGETWTTLDVPVSVGKASAGDHTVPGLKVGPWAALPVEAQADVLLRLVGQDGDGSISPVFGPIELQFR